MAYALKTSCARNIIGVIPYFPYSKQSKMRKRGSIVCKLLASMLAKAGECVVQGGSRNFSLYNLFNCYAPLGINCPSLPPPSLLGTCPQVFGLRWGKLTFVQLSFTVVSGDDPQISDQECCIDLPMLCSFWCCVFYNSVAGCQYLLQSFFFYQLIHLLKCGTQYIDIG